jgi:hypothetical protein
MAFKLSRLATGSGNGLLIAWQGTLGDLSRKAGRS